jgi:hypothetical protein
MVRVVWAIYIRVVRRNVVFRILAGMLSVWLVVCLAEPSQLHTCVMHGGLAIDAYAGGSHHAATHAAHAASTAAAKHSHHQNDDRQANQCNCLGDCNTVGTVVGVVAPSISFASNVVEVPVPAFSYASPVIVAPHFLRPFSNGPPDASSRA